MTSSMRILMALAALSGLASVVAGAFGAHGAASPLAKELLRTGASYGITHALAVFACVFVAVSGGRKALIAAGLFLAGTVLFSGSLYALALSAPRAIGMVTPVGGLAFMAGWLVLAWACVTLKTTR